MLQINPNQVLAQALGHIRAGRLADAAQQLAAVVSHAVVSGHTDWAEHALDQALAIRLDQPALLAQRGAVHKLKGRAAEAEVYARHALRLDRGEIMAATVLVDLLVDRAAPSEAVLVAQACLQRVPRAAHVQRAMSQALLMMGRAPEARLAAESACAALGNNIATLSSACAVSLYDETLDAEAISATHVRLAARIAPPPGVAPILARPRAGGRPIRVGFVSGDLRAHPVGFFIEPVLRHLDPVRFEVFTYARVPTPDTTTARLRELALNWRDTHTLSDAEVFALIQRDAIDVLIDLSGHTHGGRPALFAGRAAPVQIAYLGYPCGSGLAGIDYLLGDAQVLPPGCEPLYRERCLRLPHGFLCLQPAPDAPAVAPAPVAAGEPFTFGSFNHLAKLSDQTVALWCEVLQAVPQSRLALCALPLGERDTARFTLRRFSERGIDPRRVLMFEPSSVLSQFLRYYAQIDLALDPLPFNGGTTTVQALWQGVPTITLPGALLQQRMGLSILEQAGLPGFVARDRAHYVELARQWAARREQLQFLRAGMRERLKASALIDGARFARGFSDVIATCVQQ